MKKLIYILLVMSLLVNFWMVFGLHISSKSERTVPDNYRSARKQIYDSLSTSGKVVFLGTSLTEGFPVSEFFGPSCINRGISGDKIKQIIKRLDNILQDKPKAIIVEAGINDFRVGKSVKEVYQDFLILMDSLLVSKAELIVNPIFPTCGKYENLIPLIEEYNQLIKNYCKKNKIQFLEIYKMFLDGNVINDSYTYDCLHLTFEGYKNWAKGIKKDSRNFYQ